MCVNRCLLKNYKSLRKKDRDKEKKQPIFRLFFSVNYTISTVLSTWKK